MARYFWIGRDIGYYLNRIDQELYQLRAAVARIEAALGTPSDAVLNRISDRLDTGTDKLEDSVFSNTLPNQTPER